MRYTNMIKIEFPDGSIREYESGITGMDIAASISNRLVKEVLSIGVNGQTWDLTRPITKDAAVRLYTWDDEEGRHAFWHSSAHLMAEAIQSGHQIRHRSGYRKRILLRRRSG